MKTPGGILIMGGMYINSMKRLYIYMYIYIHIHMCLYVCMYVCQCMFIEPVCHIHMGIRAAMDKLELGA